MEQTMIQFAGFWKRFVAAIIDGVLLGVVNFVILMAGFTEKKQALHDVMAGCLVKNKM